MSAPDYPQLNQQQLDMLRLFKNPMSEEDFMQMRHLAVHLLGKRLDDLMDNWEKENNITAETYEKNNNGHLRASNKRLE